MTFQTTRYNLSKTLTPQELERLAQLSTLYGIRGLSFEENNLVVEYDASRIHEAEVLAAILNAGIAVEPKHPIPAGAFDYTGEFKDFTWPIEGLTPVNAKQK